MEPFQAQRISEEPDHDGYRSEHQIIEYEQQKPPLDVSQSMREGFPFLPQNSYHDLPQLLSVQNLSEALFEACVRRS